MKIIEDIHEHEAYFYLEKDGNRVGQMDCSLNNEQLIIQETKAQALPEIQFEEEGRLLLMYAINYARENNLKILPLCPFANSVFYKNPNLRDILK